MNPQTRHFFWQDAYRTHASSVMAFLTSRLGRREEAEDLLQETFVRAIRAEDRLREPDRLRSYLFSIAHNLMVNRARKQRRTLRFELPGSEPETLENRPDPSADDPEQTARFHDLEQRLEQILGRLSSSHRRAFELAVIQKVPYRQIAAETGWTLAQVKINVYRARRKTIAALADLLPAPQGGAP